MTQPPVAGGGPDVSVIIPHYDDLPALDRGLDALMRQTYPAARTEIVVCDNASLPAAQVEAAIAGRARLVVEPAKGAGPARNRAVAAARGSRLAFIDSDCIADPDWLAQGLAALDDPALGADLVGGRVKVFSDAARPTGADLFEQIFAFDFKSYIERKGFTGAGNLFCSKATFAAVGEFAAELSEDVEWSRRAVAMGFRLLYCHTAVVSHPTRADWPALRAKWKRMTREAYLTRRKEGRGRAGWLARQLAVAASPLFHSPRVLLRAGFTPAEKLRAIGALWRIRWWRVGEGIRLAIEDPRPGAQRPPGATRQG